MHPASQGWGLLEINPPGSIFRDEDSDTGYCRHHLLKQFQPFFAHSELIERMIYKWLICWRARRDLNPQPSDPKSDALSS
jgi:hypothetical protein